MIWGLQAQAQDSLYNLYLATESELEKSSISYQLGKSFYNKELLDSLSHILYNLTYENATI